jgi:hypothetical protein
MSKRFVVTRISKGRLRICYGDYRTESLGTDDSQLRLAISLLELSGPKAKHFKELRAAVDRFLELEQRSLEKFGKPRTFRIWRVDAKTLQVDFGGGFAELKSTAPSEQAMKRCLDDLGANQFLFDEFKKELKEFLKEEGKG